MEPSIHILSICILIQHKSRLIQQKLTKKTCQIPEIFILLVSTVTGETFSMGSGRGGKLGDNIHDRYMPLKVGSLVDKKVVSIDCSELHSAVVTGILFCF